MFPHLVPVILPMAEMSLTGSIYTILAVAIERFISVIRYSQSIIICVAIFPTVGVSPTSVVVGVVFEIMLKYAKYGILVAET